MSFRENETQMIFYEPPRSFTFWGVVFSLGSAVASVTCVYWSFRPPDEFAPGWAFIVIAILFACYSLFDLFARYSAVYTIIFDSARRQVIFRRESVFGDSAREYNFESIERFHIEQDFDVDLPAGWNVVMSLKSGEEVIIPHSFAREQHAFESVAARANGNLINENRTNRG